jgi:predicted ATPase
MTPPSATITRVQLKDYRNIQSCDVALERFNVIVGANGAGKSNFLNALQLVADALYKSLDHALRSRGGLGAIRRHSAKRNTHVEIKLSLSLITHDGSRQDASYAIGLKEKDGTPVIKDEEASIGVASFKLSSGKLMRSKSDISLPPDDGAHRQLYLIRAANIPTFKPLFDALTGIRIYHIVPGMLRHPTPPSEPNLLRDGSNLASVLRDIPHERLQQIAQFLGQIAPGVEEVRAKQLGNHETFELRQRQHKTSAWFEANQISDGTLRALAILVALTHARDKHVATLIGIEEPENALHPAATDVLVDIIALALDHTQIILTSHSADLLDSLQRSRDAVPHLLIAEQEDEQGVYINVPDPLLLDDTSLGDQLRLNRLFTKRD